MAISLKTHKILWGCAAGRCAFPDCRKKLIMDGNNFDDESLIGEECHIVARELNGPRGDSPLTPEERDEYDNLILLCRIHHKLIDDQFHTYTVHRLHEIKSAHETWVIKSLQDFSEVWNVPYQRNPYFVGREEILHHLHDVFTAGDITEKSTVICGLGGIGKTQIVIEYIYRYHHEFNSILWIKANTEAELRTSFVELAKLLGLFEQDSQNVDDAIQAVKKWLEHANNWLLIFDNADTPEQLKAYLPRFTTGQILLTSRAQVFDSLGITNPIEVLEMSPEEAMTFLLKRTERTGEDTVERNAVAELAHELGYLPLALEQAGAYIIAKKIPFWNYLVGYRKHHLSLLKKSLPRAGDYPESITTTWTINFQEVENVPIAADILRVSAFLSPDNIPFELITIGASRLGQTLSSAFDTPEYDQLTLYEALETLTRYSLIRLNTAEQTYNIHRLIQEVLKDDMDANEQSTWAKRTVEAISLIFPSIEEATEMAAWFFTQRYFSHALVCTKAIQYWNMEFLDAARLLHETAAWLATYGEYTEAEPLSKQALDIHKRLQGESHSDTIKSQMNLAGLYINQGKYDLSEPLLNKSLAALQNQAEPNDRKAACLDLLALLYSDQGQYERAEAFYQQALTVYQQILEPNHPSIVSTINNLAALYLKQDKYKLAEPLLQQALIIREKTLGTDHPDTANILVNLASIFGEQGKYEQAEIFLMRALATHEKVYGTTHPSIAISLTSLGSLYSKQGKYELAKPLLQKALAIREHLLGPDHLSITTTLINLASLYANQGMYKQAEPLYQRVLTIHEHILGSDHIGTAKSLENLTHIYFDQHKYGQAEPFLLKALIIKEKWLGTEHPETINTRHNLAQSYLFQENYKQAEPLFRQVLNSYQKAHEANPLYIANAYSSLAGIYFRRGKYKQADSFYQQALHSYENVFGPNHAYIALTLENYAKLLRKMKQIDRAARLEKRAQGIQTVLASQSQ